MSSKLENCVPLDGKTNFKTDKLEKIITNLYHETKTAIDKHSHILLEEHREVIFQKIADLLEDSEENRAKYAKDLEKRLIKSTSEKKKGRPKKKQNPWQYIIDKTEEEKLSSTDEEIETEEGIQE